MDSRLRDLERNYITEPERWIREVSRNGMLEHVRLTDPAKYWDAIIRAGRLGPNNQAVFGMLGFEPVIKCMGGHGLDPKIERMKEQDQRFTYWYKGKWYTEEQVQRTAETWGRGWWRGRDHHEYRKLLNRLSFHIRGIEWMYNIAIRDLKKDNKRSLDVWLVERENRTVLLSSLIGASWTGV